MIDRTPSRTTQAAVRARSVSKVFGTGALAFHALREVDLEVEPGEFVMLSGPSGSGKTTLLSIIGAVLAASSGQVELFGTDITRLAERELPTIRSALIGFVFQGHNLLGALDSLDNVALVSQLRGLPRKRARDEAASLLEQVGLGGRLHHRPHELSGGQRQRVAVARALAGDPPLLLADEPTASLDALAGLEVTRLMLTLCRERQTTVLVVTHDQRIFPLADRVVHIEDGRIRSQTSELAPLAPAGEEPSRRPREASVEPSTLAAGARVATARAASHRAIAERGATP